MNPYSGEGKWNTKGPSRNLASSHRNLCVEYPISRLFAGTGFCDDHL